MASVLLVDDEQETLEAIQPFLELKGFTVWTAAQGDRAISLIQQHHPNVVLLDVNLQGSSVSGLEVLKASKEQSPATKVYLVSGYDTDEYKAKATPLGADGFLEKPLALDKLLEFLRSLDPQKP